MNEDRQAWWNNMTLEQMQSFIREKEERILGMLEEFERLRTTQENGN